jgi:Ca-activated chloride channel family protein
MKQRRNLLRFESPYYLFLLLLLAVIYLLRDKTFGSAKGTLRHSNLRMFEHAPSNVKTWIVKHVFLLRLLLMGMVIFALARPQVGQSFENYLTEGIDIILAIDASGSMRAEDFAPKNRLEVAKEKVREFIKNREGDRIGMVVFGEESFTLCPLTSDYLFLLKRIDELHLGVVPEDKTAIGMGLANSLNRLKTSKAKSKIIILLTDGVNNAGKIHPLTAAQMAKSLNVKIYTIGIGKEGWVQMPVEHPLMGKTYIQMKTEIDEETLHNIAEQTGGLYFRASSEEALKEIYHKIDRMEKTKSQVKIYAEYREFFPYLMWPVFFLLFIERILARIWLRVLP